MGIAVSKLGASIYGIDMWHLWQAVGLSANLFVPEG
jgi:hypothetical protein